MRFIRLFTFFISYFHLFLVHSQDPGELEEISGSPFSTETSPVFVTFSPLVNENLFAAVANKKDQTVSVYSVDQTTGSFTPVTDSPFPTGASPRSVAFSPLVNENLFAAVANEGSNTVSVYSVDQTTGSFTPVTDSPFPTGASPRSVIFSPLVNESLFAAVTSEGSQTISVYSVDQTTGFFTPVTDSPFPTGALPRSAAFSPLVNENLFAAVANEGSNTVSVYSVDQTTGFFTPVTDSPFPTETSPRSVAFSPLVNENLFAAVASRNNQTVSVYFVDQTTGFFTPVTDSPFPTGVSSFSVAFSPLVNETLFAAVANEGSNNVSVYFVDQTTGFFTPVTDSPFPTGASPRSVAFSPLVNENLFAAVANTQSGTVSVYNVVIPSPVTVLPTPPPPTDATVSQTIEIQGNKIQYMNVLTWRQRPTDPSIINYRIYQDRCLTKLITTIPSNKKQRIRILSKKNKIPNYYIVAVNIYGGVSRAVGLKKFKVLDTIRF